MRDTIDMAREAGGRAQQNKNCDVEYLMSSESLQRLVESVRADEREAFAAKIQAEIDHAYLNELRLVPSFGKRQGDIAVRAAHLEAALDAILARGQA